jgi:acetoin utilization protein AcuB
MLVQDIMQAELITILPETTLPEALRLVQRRGVRHLPVVENGNLVGIVSDRDLKRAMPSAATSLSAQELNYLLDRVTVGEFMTRGVITIAPMFPVEEAARIMVTEKISALPVTEGGRLVGIVTETDVLRLFAKAMGAMEPSSRLDVLLGDRPAGLGEVIQIVEGAGTPISSVMTLAGRGGAKEAVIRVATINPGAAIKALEAKGYIVRDSWRG